MSRRAAWACASSCADFEDEDGLALLAPVVSAPLSRAAACWCASPAVGDEFDRICVPALDDVRTPLSKAEACACASGDRVEVVVAAAGPLAIAAAATNIDMESKRDFISRPLPEVVWRTRGAKGAAVRWEGRLGGDRRRSQSIVQWRPIANVYGEQFAAPRLSCRFVGFRPVRIDRTGRSALNERSPIPLRPRLRLQVDVVPSDQQHHIIRK